eukprot:517439-Rhodomonas_salina.1
MPLVSEGCWAERVVCLWRKAGGGKPERGSVQAHEGGGGGGGSEHERERREEISCVKGAESD